jgi:hypothetical protein
LRITLFASSLCTCFQVLMGQAEVINWMKSTPEKLVTMRYAGEWKLPGLPRVLSHAKCMLDLCTCGCSC